MPVLLNHTIVWVRDKATAAGSVASLLGVAEPAPFGPFLVLTLGNDVSLDFADSDEQIHPQHYAFLVGEPDFDAILGRIRDRGLPYWADPGRHRPDEINTGDGGRGVYWEGPDGHLLEIITRPYGSG
jgi:catechol 2,3-dioxygenase-like lactoylglutathione lyase family enzyme